MGKTTFYYFVVGSRVYEFRMLLTVSEDEFYESVSDDSDDDDGVDY